ncbi:hypothetical protein ARMSODRAFT_1027138 [Armillaria solidipes]|uniref:F-box domain-containing protein n=1 Tax=Armillaria solidipes TaxID=1076256 RepID=A0A2H3ALU2_9AGAR|nr:hypothetical protein ARMSODRAFT_1027138 [Armillaria solidipes]
MAERPHTHCYWPIDLFYKRIDEFTGIEELLALFLEHSDIISLVQLSHTNRTFRRLVRDTLTIRLRQSLLTFIPRSNLAEFFTIIDWTNACIAGSVALTTLTPACDWSPDDLNIIVPAGSTPTWESFFHNHGFERLSHVDDVKYHRCQMGTSLVMIFCHPSLQTEVIVTQSMNDSIFAPLLTSEVSSQMNIITSSHIYCLYPALTADRVAVNAWHARPDTIVPDQPQNVTPHRKQRILEQNLTLYEDGRRPDRRCGIECPLYLRSLRGLRDIGILHWGGWDGVKADTSNLIPSCDLHYNWSLGNTCHNSRCHRATSTGS